MSEWLGLIVLSLFTVHLWAAEFPGNYADARKNFLAAVTDAAPGSFPPERATFPIASEDQANLTVDTAYFEAGGTDLIILQSGLHGVEAPAGSQVQVDFLKQRLETFRSRKVSVLFIHAINPWGFAHLRRTDADNVNLNRNFSRADSLFQSRSEGYEKIRSAIEPAGAVGGRRLAYLRARSRLLVAFVKSGFDRRGITVGMNNGQYESPQGLNYGGSKAQPQTKILDNLLKSAMAGKRRVIFVDLHTGLGDSGVLHLMSAANSDKEMQARIEGLLNEAHTPLVSFTSTNQSGFFPTRGDVTEFAASAAPTTILALTAEFGTVGSGFFPQLYSAALLITENQAHHYGCADSLDCESIHDDFARLFNPDSESWREKVTSGASLLFDRLASLFS